MADNKLQRTNRRAIYSSLLVWLAVHFTQLLKPYGVPTMVSSSLLVAGLIALPLFVLWPWLRESLFEIARNDPEEPLGERRLQALVSLEIIALCVVLLILLLYL